jgi:predicted TIM-barrel fold metal-dependent hydrolase
MEMVVDSHYHYYQLPSDDQKALEFVAWQLRMGERASGIRKSAQEAMPMARDLTDDVDCEKLVRRMDQYGIDVTALLVVDVLERGMSDEAVLGMNEECAKAAARHPGRTFPLASVDPRRPNAPALLRHCIEKLHMKGLKWHPEEGFYVNGEEAYRVLEVANEHCLPVIVHCAPATEGRAKYCQTIFLDDIAMDFPHIALIAAHMGYIGWREWVGLAQLKSNIYGDLAMWDLMAVGKPHLFRRYLREMLDIVGPDQILFATDGPSFEPLVPTSQWLGIVRDLTKEGADGIRFTEEEVKAILGGNAARIYKL